MDSWKKDHLFTASEHLHKSLDIHDSNMFYHYTSLSTFWKILENDSLFARHVKFSNDKYEYDIGTKLASYILEKERNVSSIIPQTDCYMLCFCTDHDKLSQWREYAKYGVSIGFEFNRTLFFTCIKNNVDDILLAGRPYKAYYIEYPESGRFDELDFLKNDKDFRKIFDASGEGKKIQGILEKIPFFKDKRFAEEDESRIIFKNLHGYLDKHISYQDLEQKKVPYITVKFGDNSISSRKRCYFYLSNNCDEIAALIKRERVKYFICNNINNDPSHLSCANNGNNCYDCNMKVNQMGTEEKTIIISAGTKEAQISAYKRIKEILKNKQIGNVKIWFEGHLPIRNVMIGPCIDQAEVIESVKKFISQFYWMKDVGVFACKTPYRSPRM